MNAALCAAFCLSGKAEKLSRLKESDNAFSEGK